MNRCHERWLCIFLIVLGTACWASGEESPRTVSIEQFRAEIQRIAAGVVTLQQSAQVAPLKNSIPDKYVVATPAGTITVDNAELKRSVGGLFLEKTRASVRAKLEQELHSIDEGVAQFEGMPNPAPAHDRLSKILAAQEFDEVRGPTLLEIWRDKIAETLSRWWEKLVGKLPSPGGGHQEYTWLLIAICACVLAIWLKRMYGRREPETPREIIPFAPSGKHWRTWLGEAQAAAGEGRWRDAIHLAYWAAISHLESNGAWTPDAARTPREYLRLMRANNPSRGDLVALTRDFERIWYGSHQAGDGEFHQALQHLERLGCR